MPTEFSYEHVFRAPSTETILAAYFDADHLATQDKLADLVDRTVTEDHDDGAIRRTTWRVTAAKPLPVFVRPFVKGGRLSYFEAMTWRRKDDACDLTVTPDILNGRVQIQALYKLEKIGENQIRRTYSGKVTVNITLLSGKIERGIVAEFEKSMAMMANCTQTWLDAHPAT
ncbi:MAG: DUF2505 family protein [Polyangiales bacterium]